jgi:hypothetical protein
MMWQLNGVCLLVKEDPHESILFKIDHQSFFGELKPLLKNYYIPGYSKSHDINVSTHKNVRNHDFTFDAAAH